MADKQIDLNVDAKEENFDLVLRLSDGTPGSNKEKKAHIEEVVNTGRRLEERFMALERKLQQVEKLVDQRAHELAARVDQHFLYSGQSIHERLGRNSARLDDIHSILHSIIMSFRPTITSEHQQPASTTKLGASSSGAKRPPRP